MEGLLVTTIDNESPSGSWRKEWDARSHTPQEYIEKIRELRLRNKEYLREIEDLKHVIENLKEELVVIDRLIYRSNRYESE
jgi:ribosomal protein L19E